MSDELAITPPRRSRHRLLAPAVSVAAVAAVSVGAAVLVAMTGDSTGAGSAELPKLARQDTFAAAATSEDSAGIVVRGPLPTGPTTGTVYRFSPTPAPRGQVEDLARALGLAGTPEHTDGAWTLAGTADMTLWVSDRPGWQWGLGSQAEDAGAASTPDDTAAGENSAGPVMPPDPDEPVGTPAGPDLPADPPPLPPHPDQAAVRAVADPILDALGATPDRHVSTGPGFAEVRVDPEVAGLPTFGFATYARLGVRPDRTGGVDLTGVGGWLATPVAAQSYPLRTAQDALDAGGLAPRCEPCPTAPATVGGAEYGLMLHTDVDDTLLLAPAWLVDVAGSDLPAALLAVGEEYVGDPAGPGDGTRGGGAGPGDGGGVVAVPPAPAEPDAGTGEGTQASGAPGRGTPTP